jgi:hypothetical protein
MKWREKLTAAEIGFETGRVPTEDEVHAKLDDERAIAAAKAFEEKVRNAPFGVWFPSDDLGQMQPRGRQSGLSLAQQVALRVADALDWLGGKRL